MLKRLANAAKTWVVVGVGALVLALSAFFILSNFSPDSTFAHPHEPVQDHPGVGEDVEHIHYDEEDDVPVITLMSTDPETGDTVDWDVTGTDGDDFTISSSGVLNFKQMPNYEKPVDYSLDANNDGDFGDADDVAPDNVYQITVRATEQTTPGDPNGRALSTKTDLIIVVNNVDEDGVVELNLLQPEVGTPITAMLTDPDSPAGIEANNIAWVWTVSKVTNPDPKTEAHWAAVTGTANAAIYTPTGIRTAAIPGDQRPAPDPANAIDEGETLRATATYTDGFGEMRMAIGTSVHPVRAEVDSNLDAGVEDATNDSPGFRQGLNYGRSVPESTLVDMNVGGRVTALDPNGDILSYSLMRVGEQTAPNYGDVDFFNIDRASGQITIKKMLDFEEMDGRFDDTDDPVAGEYKVIVRATDPSGETGDVAVTITATAANDAPVISGREELRVMEQDSDDRDGDASPDNTYTGLPDMNVNQVSTNGDNPNVYRASDDDARGLISWDLKQSNSDPEAVDYAMFELSSTDLTGDGRPRAIRFKNAPDFEDPGDANRDNVYKVTLVATDGSGRDEHRVSIFVMNVHEQGELALMASGNDPAQPVIGQPITAMVGDPDGGIAEVTWQWSRSNTKDGDYTPITGATSATYIPQGDRPSGLEDNVDTEDVDESVTSDVGMFLRAVATYLDATSAVDDPAADDTFDARVQTDATTAKTAVAGDGTDDGGGTEGDVYRVMVTTEKAVRASDADPGTTDPDAPPTPPTFDPGSYTGTVYENSEVGSLVAMSKMVSAGEDQELKLLEADSDDNKYFMIDEHGQIRVGEVPYPDPLPTGVQAPTPLTEPAMVDPDQDLVPALDHEIRTTYRLVISAENDGGKSTANMTISVSDRNEHPYFDKATREIDLVTDDTDFDGTIQFTEFVAGAAYNRKVTDLAAVEPDGDDLHWEVIGTDAADFETVNAPDGPDGKDRVELRFNENSRPDFERPMDRAYVKDLNDDGDTDDAGETDAAKNNMYKITVRVTEATTVGANVPPKAAELDLTVVVRDSEEKGSVQINLRQPEVMTAITASLTDPDAVALTATPPNVDGDLDTGVTYKWYRAKGSNFDRNITELDDNGNNQWEPITGGTPESATYTPQGAPPDDPETTPNENTADPAARIDEGRHLLVRATYNSDIPSTDDQGITVETPPVVAFGITEFPVRADVHNDSNNSPGFPQGSLTRTVEEDIDVDDPVGNAVQVDLNEDNDVLTYSLVTSDDGDDGADGNSDVVEEDLPFFYIDNDTGQIRVKKALSFEGHDDVGTTDVVEASEYQVVVRATDPSGEPNEENRDDITVVITVTDVNEAPKVTDGFSIIQVYEVNESKESTDGADYYIGLGNVRITNNTADDTSDDTVDENANDQNYYKKSDEDPVDSHEWPNNPIPGPDGQWFEYSTAEDGVRLHFIDRPDYEDPNDANGDNVYEVCVTAVDNGNMRGCKMVRIEVMNVQEDGMLMLTPADPVDATAGDGVEITATLTDPDGEVVITDWNWANRGLSGGMFSEAEMVGGQTTMTFKGEVGNFVWSEVHYRDGASVVDDPVTALDERNDAMDGGTVEQHKFQNLTDGDPPALDANDQSFHNSDEMLEKVTDSAVQAPAGDTTTIDLGDTTTDPTGPPSVINIERMVPENTPSTGYVGTPLMASEMPGTMTGPDANLFVFAEDEDESNDGYYDSDLQDTPDVMDKMGQLALAVTPAGNPITDLDYESSKNSYTIEFSEGQANSDIIRVTILVTDVNEAPSMPMEARGGIHINGPPSINRYNEMRTDMVATYSTTGGEAGATVTWSLDGDDRADFRISSAGELTFRAIPDYEDPMDSNTDNIYSITVEVQDDTTPNPNVDTLFRDGDGGERGRTWDADGNVGQARSGPDDYGDAGGR